MADPNTYINIYVTHVFELSPCVNRPEYSNILFWGQHNREAALTMQDHFTRASKVIEESSTPVLNDFRKVKMVLASVCGDWVRAKIKDLTIDKNGLIDVFCIDHGLFQSLPLKMLRHVPEHLEYLLDCPPLASKYCLADIVVSKDSELKEKTDHYLTAMIRHKTVKAVMLGSYEGFDGARIYLNDQLVAKNLHDMKFVSPGKTFKEAIGMPTPATELPLPKLNFVFTPNNLLAKTSSSAPVCIARPLVSSQSPQPVQLVQQKPWPVKPVAPAQDNYTAAFLGKDSVHHVTVTHVQNGPWRFTVRRKCAETDFGLADVQQRIANLATNQLKPMASPSRGSPCIAMSTSDNSLNRGLITASEDTQTFNVYFVDHGRFELVSQSKLFQIPNDLIAIDLMSVRVCLYEAEELSKFNGVIERFSKMALNKSFHCRVVDDSTPQVILMFDDSGRNVKDILKASFTHPHLLLDANTPSIFLNAPKKEPSLSSSRPEHARVYSKVMFNFLLIVSCFN